MSKNRKMRLEMMERKLEATNGENTSDNPNDNLFRKYTYASGFKNVDSVQKSLVTVINFELCCERMSFSSYNTLDIDSFYDALSGISPTMVVGPSKTDVAKPYRHGFKTGTIPLLKHLKKYFLKTKDLYDIIHTNTVLDEHSAMFLLSNAIKYRGFNANHTVSGGANLAEKRDINSLITMLKNVISNYEKYGNGYYKNPVAHVC